MADPTPVPNLPELLGESPAMEPVRRVLARAARVDAPVVLEGETGTGKSLAARWIHHRGSRHGGPFVGVNCAGIPDQLFESEFFGHRRGAFTGAVEDRAGLFEAASGGTLFLDEVAELPGVQQAKLLTVLEEGRVRRVGEADCRPVDTRVVAATSRDLDRAVRDGSFRADLFHRLALLRCTLPPLRGREGDPALLADRFLDELGRKHLGTPAGLTPAARRIVAEHDWPGNVRELAHALEAALILAGRGLLDRRHLEEVIRRDEDVAGQSEALPPAPEPTASERPAPSAPVAPPAHSAPTAPTARGEGGRYSFHGTDEEEREVIRSALERFRGNRTRTARHLGMSRATLRSRIGRYDL